MDGNLAGRRELALTQELGARQEIKKRILLLEGLACYYVFDLICTHAYPNAHERAWAREHLVNKACTDSHRVQGLTVGIIPIVAAISTTTDVSNGKDNAPVHNGQARGRK